MNDKKKLKEIIRSIVREVISEASYNQQLNKMDVVLKKAFVYVNKEIERAKKEHDNELLTRMNTILGKMKSDLQ